MLPGGVLLFFAFGSWLAALLLWSGVIESVPVSLGIFTVTSVLSMLLLRKYVVRTFKGRKSGEGIENEEREFIGKLATVREDINPDREGGKVEFRGVMWTATADELIEKGSSVRIVGRENLTVRVERV
ncbi:MAG: NfeD family protein [bacterium]|nr:NfeD family protein [bacterium]